MGNYLDRYVKRTIGTCNSVKERNIEELRNEFDEFANDAYSGQEYIYTKVNELPDLDTNERALMVIKDVTSNDKKNLDEKYLLAKYGIDIEVGCYVHDGYDWYLIEYRESKATDTYNKFTMRRCNVMLNLAVEGKVYPMPVSISNLTMYSAGIKEFKYIDEFNAKRDIHVGANPITNKIRETDRIMVTRDTTFRITHINDFEYTRRDYSAGLLKWMCSQTVALSEDNIDDKIAYNPISKGETDGINGDNFIYIGAENEYKVDDVDATFELDRIYSFATLVDNHDGTCVLTCKVDFDIPGEDIMIIAKKSDGSTLDTKVVKVRGI